ncbi:MAG: hypothetical protein ACNA8W_22795 [Bradymonadaceae bacterium]
MNELSQPVVFITTIQPFLLLWVVSVCFFITLAAVAMLSRGRRWFELGAMFVVIFGLTTVVGLAGTSAFLDITIFDVEVIRYVIGY